MPQALYKQPFYKQHILVLYGQPPNTIGTMKFSTRVGYKLDLANNPTRPKQINAARNALLNTELTQKKLDVYQLG